MTVKQFEIFSEFSVKEADGEDFITIVGYANTTDKDRMGDIVLREAWEKGGLKNYKKNPIVLAFHDSRSPIGRVIEHEVTDKGLKVVAKISKAAGNVYSLIKEQVLNTFSIGFRVKDADFDKTTGIFVIKNLELLEISVVSIPANANATFSVRKSFENEDEYEEFKKDFVKEEEVEKKELSNTPAPNVEEIISKTVQSTIESLEAQRKTQEETKLKGEKMPDVTTGKEGVEVLLETINKRLEAYEASNKDNSAKKEAEVADLVKQLDDLRGELKEKSEEIDNFRKNKMTFENKGDQISKEDRINAALLAKCLGRKTEDTSFGRGLIQKSGGQHIPATTDGTNLLWEEELATTLLNDYRNRLIVAEAMTAGGTRLVNMNTPVMRLPVNPEAGVGLWIPNAHLRSTQGPLSGSPSSTGSPKIHTLTDITLTAYKLAAKEYLGYEEEEDSIIPLLPLIREAIARRMARSWDIALLRGAGSATALVNTNDPISGLVTRAGSPLTTGNVGSISKFTVATLQTLRKGLGARGLDPNDVIYIVSNDAYYDLLEDPDFRTPDVIGADRATILKGTVRMVNGSQVIASGEFATKATGVGGAVAVYRPNFIIGELRGMMLERDKSVEDQVNILVATRRVAFGQIVASVGVKAGYWA